ncbi:MAG: uroporphyrinogen decarboxylase family protein [Eubacteriales bacterium]
MDVQKLQEKRTKMYTDVYTNVIPENFPVQDNLDWNFLIEYAGEDLMMTQYTYTSEKVIEILEKAREILRGDNLTGAGGHNPISLMFQQCIQNVMGSTGMIQHPEREYMLNNEYDALIKNPYDFMLERISPRLNLAYSKSEINHVFAFARYILSVHDLGAIFGSANKYIKDKYGLYSPPAGSGTHQYVPFDFLADHCRGFSHIPLDIRRQPESVIDALEALVPFCIWSGKNKVQSPLGSNMIPTHMGAYLRETDFEKFYWPTFSQIVHMTAERGQAMYIFLENDWTRFLDYLEELPMGTRLYMEYGDAQKFKDRLGKKMILSGFYPLTLLKTGTKQQCIDKAKELIDILAPGGNFCFCFDKKALKLSDVNPENYIAVMEYAIENSKYQNSGQKVSSIHKKDTIKKYHCPEFKSKYIISFEEFKKEFPPIDKRIEPFMREGYEKYTDMLRLNLIHAL